MLCFCLREVRSGEEESLATGEQRIDKRQGTTLYGREEKMKGKKLESFPTSRMIVVRTPSYWSVMWTLVVRTIISRRLGTPGRRMQQPTKDGQR